MGRIMEDIDIPAVLEQAFKEMLNNYYLKELLPRLDKWLECSCEQVYHYNLRYYLDKLLPKSISIKIKDEKTLKKICKENCCLRENQKKKGHEKDKRVGRVGKGSKVDIHIEDKDVFIEMKMGKMHHSLNISDSDFKKLYLKDINKLARIKNEKGVNCRCFLLKITHDINNVPKKIQDKYPDIKGASYADKVRKLKKIYDKCIVNKFSEIDKGYGCLAPYKLKFVADSSNLENDVFIYHLWEVVEK